MYFFFEMIFLVDFFYFVARNITLIMLPIFKETSGWKLLNLFFSVHFILFIYLEAKTMIKMTIRWKIGLVLIDQH